MYKKILKIKKVSFIALFTLFLVIPQVVLASFSDVPQTHSQYDEITALESQRVLGGYSDGTFRPDDFINRAAFLKATFTSTGYSPDPGIYETVYWDVPSDIWFAPYIKIAYDLGLMKVSPTNPNAYPSDPIINIEGLKILMPLQGIPSPLVDNNTNLIFGDVKNDAAYAYIIKAAQNSGLYIDRHEPFFRPFEKLTRGDAAELIYKAQQFRESNGTPIVTVDLSGSSFTEDDVRLQIFADVWSRLNNDYIDSNNIDQDDLIYTAIEGMMDALGDDYSEFYDPVEALTTQQSIQGEFEGVGIVLDDFEGQVVILEVLENSPAKAAGIRDGDFITHVDGISVSSKSINDVAELIRGEADTTVKLTIKRDSGTTIYTVNRQEIHIDSVYFGFTDFDVPVEIAYITIFQFTNQTEPEFKKIISENITENTKGIILDLRNNPGGTVSSAYEIAEHFLQDGEIIANYKIGGQIYAHRTFSNPDLSHLPVVILVNDNTASAAEILAAALKENYGSKLVGEQTYGKATVQELTIYTDGSMLKLSIAKWLTPSSKDINEIGLSPDVSINKSASDISGDTDSQLNKAIQELQKLY
ncbi:S41 family peptidase [Pseudomonadota bacterium]